MYSRTRSVADMLRPLLFPLYLLLFILYIPEKTPAPSVPSIISSLLCVPLGHSGRTSLRTRCSQLWLYVSFSLMPFLSPCGGGLPEQSTESTAWETHVHTHGSVAIQHRPDEAWARHHQGHEVATRRAVLPAGDPDRTDEVLGAPPHVTTALVSRPRSDFNEPGTASPVRSAHAPAPAQRRGDRYFSQTEQHMRTGNISLGGRVVPMATQHIVVVVYAPRYADTLLSSPTPHPCPPHGRVAPCSVRDHAAVLVGRVWVALNPTPSGM